MTAHAAPGALAVEARGLVVSYRLRRVLDRVDLQIRAGELLALMGPNGAGKTTLVRALCGRIAPDAGAVGVFGANPRTSASTRALIGYVPQQVALYPHLTVRENLVAFARLAGAAPRDLARAVDRALATTRLAIHAHDRLDSLSGGYQRRASVAAAALHAPQLLLLDEPSAGVDIEARRAIHGALETLHAGGTTIVIVTHDAQEVEAIADRVVIMAGGRALRDGVPARLVAEAFGESKELIVELTDAPIAPEQREALARAGFTQQGAGVIWVASAQGMADLSMRGAELERLGVPVKEMRVRRPDLESLMLRVAAGAAA